MITTRLKFIQMLRLLLTYIALFLTAAMSMAQPTGKLFVHTGNTSYGRLAYIQYPQAQYHAMDSIMLTDMKIFDDRLFVSGAQVYAFDLNTLQMTDSFGITLATHIGLEGNHLVVARAQAPYVQVYDLTTKNLIFSLDTNKVKLQPADMLVDAGRVYLLFDTTMTVADIALQDTLATFTATYNAWFPCFNQYLINGTDKIYIHVGIATGAPRFAMLSLTKASFQVQDVLFQEYVDAYYRPVLAADKIYMSYFPSYYDITADTFIYDGSHVNTFPLTNDSISNTVFLYNPLSLNVSFFNNNVYSSTLSLPGYVNKAVYYNEAVAGLQTPEDNAGITIYPNPVTEMLYLDFGREMQIKSLKIYSLNGSTAGQINAMETKSCTMDVAHLKQGVYCIEIQSDNKVIKKKFVKIAD